MQRKMIFDRSGVTVCVTASATACEEEEKHEIALSVFASFNSISNSSLIKKVLFHEKNKQLINFDFYQFHSFSAPYATMKQVAAIMVWQHASVVKVNWMVRFGCLTPKLL